MRVEVDENESLPNIHGHGCQSVLAFVEIGVILLLRDVCEPSVQRIAPSVILACELTAGALGLEPIISAPRELVAAMGAHVMKGANPIIRAPHDENRGVADRQFAGE